MRLILEGNPEEIAALVLAVQERRRSACDRKNVEHPIETIQKAFRSAIDGIVEEAANVFVKNVYCSCVNKSIELRSIGAA